MGFCPVLSDINSSGDPDLGLGLNIVKETSYGRRASWSPAQPTMQSHRHHLWLIRAFFVQHIKTVFEIVEKLVARVEPLGGSEPHIIGVERVRDNQMRSPVLVVPIGQVISVGVRIVKEASFFYAQLAGVWSGASLIKT